MSGGFSNLDQTSSEHTIVHIYLHESIHLLNANHKFCKLQVVLYTIVLVYIGFVSSYGITASCVFGWNCHDLLSALSEKYIRITDGRPTDPISQLSSIIAPKCQLWLPVITCNPICEHNTTAWRTEWHDIKCTPSVPYFQNQLILLT